MDEELFQISSGHEIKAPFTPHIELRVQVQENRYVYVPALIIEVLSKTTLYSELKRNEQEYNNSWQS